MSAGIVHLSDDITIDFGPNEEFVGIEVLNAKTMLKNGNLPQIAMENIPKDWVTLVIYRL